MARPKKSRKVCSMPTNNGFQPLTPAEEACIITMSVDEYETIRLIDLKGYTQEECATQMKIARTTVQAMYNEARKKIAEALVHGKGLLIEGGDFSLCEENKGCCEQGGFCNCNKKAEEA